VDERRIAHIVEQVVAKLASEGGPSGPAVLRHPRGAGHVEGGGLGVHPTIDAAVAAAKRAFDGIQQASLADRARYIQALRDTTRADLETIARMAVEESGLGRFADKIAKNRLVADKTPGIEILQTTAWTGDDGMTLVEWAPYGVIGSITPCTNPTETILNNGIGMLAAGNAVVFNTHPSAKRVSAYFIDRLNLAGTIKRSTKKCEQKKL